MREPATPWHEIDLAIDVLVALVWVSAFKLEVHRTAQEDGLAASSTCHLGVSQSQH